MSETAGLPAERDEYGGAFAVQPGDVWHFLKWIFPF